MQVNVGGDRLGSGAKMQIDLHNYNRSTHNLNKNFKSSLACGCLYPAYVNVGLNGDKFEMDINSIVRTLPTQGPLFGAFKMQVDVFVAPMRLYQGILHNNPINIGLQMANIKLPKVRLFDKGNTDKISQVHPSNLWKYLGLSGLGIKDDTMPVNANIYRDVNALPLLVYYDIFKNYYANKQEDEAFVIGDNLITNNTEIDEIIYQGVSYPINAQISVTQGDGILKVIGYSLYTNNQLNIIITDQYNNNITNYFPIKEITENEIIFYIQYTGDIKVLHKDSEVTSGGIKLQSFPLENIDKMRESILKFTELGETFMVNDFVDDADDSLMLQPYQAACGFDSTKRVGFQSQPMCGLVVKTYQSDLFNNWIKTETIDGTNGIREITTIDTTNGLELDALNLAQKVYNMLNRIAVSGGTYEDWQEAVYTSSTIRKAETPMYMGGMSSEIMFEEVIATTAAETNRDGKQSLGSLGGRGRQINRNGGRVEFKIEEPSIIMAIVSLTPRICYSQGNKWFLTELDSIDDLHKPALDGIGYQDLVVERMAWWDTKIKNYIQNGETMTDIVRNSVGKVPAWIEYMTDIDECYGDFALDAATSFMVLNRDYAQDENKNVSDITTYIDPSKYNYAFAYNELFAQNFWAEIQFDVKARRLMSAKQIPNL